MTPLFGSITENNQEYLKVQTKNQQGETNRNTVPLYVPILKTGSYKEILKLLTSIKKTNGKDLKMIPQSYVMTNKLLSGESHVQREWYYK